MSNELKAVLEERLRKNYEDFLAQLQGKSVSELIAMAPEITAAKQCHEELLDACDDDDVAFLLRFNDPLEVVRGYWEAEITGHDHSGEMGHMLWEIRDREMYSGEQLIQPSEDAGELPSSAVQDEKSEETGDVSMSDKLISQISTDDLRKMRDKEGLILQGCGGPLQEWVDGINDLLTEAGILRDGSRFASVSTFQHDGLTCLLFPFENVKLDMGRLAMWRIQTHSQFGGTWLSDYVPNRLGGFEKEQAPRQKPKMKLLGHDGNIFALMGTASQLLQMAGMYDQNKEMIDRVTSCKDYYKALNIISEYVETELSPEIVPKKSQKKKARNTNER